MRKFSVEIFWVVFMLQMGCLHAVEADRDAPDTELKTVRIKGVFETAGFPVEILANGQPAQINGNNWTADIQLNRHSKQVVIEINAGGHVQSMILPLQVPERYPVANDMSFALIVGQTQTITLDGYDPDGGPVTFALDRLPTGGNLSGSNGQYVYTPISGFLGADSFTYTVTNQNQRTVTGTVHVTVLPDSPVTLAQTTAAPARLFETLEFKLWLDPEALGIAALHPSELFNAYDSTRGWIRAALVVSPQALTTATVRQIYDAYEDRGEAPAYDGAAPFVVPCFHMRERRDDNLQEPAFGSWRWRARIGLISTGPWYFYACVRVKPSNGPERRFPDPSFSNAKFVQLWTYENYAAARFPEQSSGLSLTHPPLDTPAAQGPLMNTYSNSGRYFKRKQYEQGGVVEKNFFGIGFARPWNIKQGGVARWNSSYIPFEQQMQQLSSVGGNLYSWWLVSWDSAPVHGMGGLALDEYYEHWDEDRNGENENAKRIEDSSIIGAPYRHFDQGRCLKIDELMQAAENHGIHVILTFWPHPDIREPGTYWDVFSNATRYGAGWTDGLGRWFKQTTMVPLSNPTEFITPHDYHSGWVWLDKTPLAFAQDWNGSSGIYQKNFLRYVAARWGLRKGLGLYEWISEYNGTVFTENGSAEAIWRANARNFMHSISPYKQPFCSSSHTVTEAWGKPALTDAANDFVNIHGYCRVSDGSLTNGMNNDELNGAGRIKDNHAYKESVFFEHGVFYHKRKNELKPTLCGEVGAAQRRPGTEVSRDMPLVLTHGGANQQENASDSAVEWRYRKAVSTLHYTVWAALFSKASSIPLAWCDGKEFGELKARDGNVRFSEANYALDYLQELAAVSKLVQTLQLESRLDGMQFVSGKAINKDSSVFVSGDLHVAILQNNTHALVWLVRKNATMVSTVNLLTLGVSGATTAKIRWFNPWTGNEIGSAQEAVNLNSVSTRFDQVLFERACAGTGDGQGPHEKEDAILWVEK